MISHLAFLAMAHQVPANLFDVTKSEFAVFNLRDSAARGMDCLKVVSSSDGRKLYGVYHSLQNGVFELWLAESYDAKTWKALRMLDDHAHQGTIAISPDGNALVAWEKDVPGKGNHIHIAYFLSEERLEVGRAVKAKDIDRTFSPSAEGTPSFESIVWSSVPPKVVLGFHYWRNSDVDRQAVGRLDEKWNWGCVKRPKYDALVEKFGVKGNIGDRDTFDLRGSYTILEGMKKKDDWSSWGLYLVGPNQKCSPVVVKTPYNSKSFANPSVTVIGNRAYVTMFMPSQGNDPRESGELLYVVKLRN